MDKGGDTFGLIYEYFLGQFDRRGKGRPILLAQIDRQLYRGNDRALSGSRL